MEAQLLCLNILSYTDMACYSLIKIYTDTDISAKSYTAYQPGPSWSSPNEENYFTTMSSVALEEFIKAGLKISFQFWTILC